MAKGRRQGSRISRDQAKHDDNSAVIEKTYGNWAALRRRLADSHTDIVERKGLLTRFANCADSQRAFLLLDDYFERISLNRKDFAGKDWWPRLLAARGNSRLEETALLFLRSNRQLPTELTPYANWDRLAELEAMEREHELVAGLENWLLPPRVHHLDSPRATIDIRCHLEPGGKGSSFHRLVIRMILTRTRSGRQYRDLDEITEINIRASHERELYSSEDWHFLDWLVRHYRGNHSRKERISMEGTELLHWLSEWGHRSRIHFRDEGTPVRFGGQMSAIRHRVDNLDGKLFLTHILAIGNRTTLPLARIRFLAGNPSLVWTGKEFLLLHNPPPESLARWLLQKPLLPATHLPPRLLEYFRHHALQGRSLENFDAGGADAPADKGMLRELECWLMPSETVALPGKSLWIRCELVSAPSDNPMHRLAISLSRSRFGRSLLSLEQALDEEQDKDVRECLEWIKRNSTHSRTCPKHHELQGMRLLQWLARWSHLPRIELKGTGASIRFTGQLIELDPRIEKVDELLHLTLALRTPKQARVPFSRARFFAGTPTLALVGNEFLVFRNAPDEELLARIGRTPNIPMHNLTHRILDYLRRNGNGTDVRWEDLCICHPARPHFLFNLEDDTVRLRLRAESDHDGSLWQWNGLEWQKLGDIGREKPFANPESKPEFLDDERLDEATRWLRDFDCFTPEPGLWIGDASERFLEVLSQAWNRRPERAEFLGNQAFQRLFLKRKRLRPRLILRGSGIDWLTVSAEWEQEGMELTEADIQRLRTCTDRYVKLPDAGWVELDTESVIDAQETMAELGIGEIREAEQRVSLIHAASMDDEKLARFGKGRRVEELKERIENFKGIGRIPLPEGIHARLRPYQQEGFDFLCHLAAIGMGGVLADDMGLGKTLQTLCWIKYRKDMLEAEGGTRPFLVICPASVLHNWRRETEKFVPELKVLLLESGEERHELRKEIPEHDITITNYSIMRRDSDELQKFRFDAVILDEAQYIKNPSAQVTRSVKKLRAEHRLALTGTPLENRLLDLWSLVDFVQPGYLGTQTRFSELYEPRKDFSTDRRRISRKHLSAKLRPVLLRRLKTQVARDLPERIDERRDCVLTTEQRRIYLGELRRSRDQIFKAMEKNGIKQSKIHVLAALTRLRQICCHPRLVGSDAGSGKTEILIELLESLLAENQKVLVFSQFVQMLQILEAECRHREMPTHILTGQTKNRTKVVNDFQTSEEPSVFLLSLRAAGTGLNLTTASYVILYDPWWNPAVEAQAIDRTHRIGQTRTVNAYRLISPGTVEDKIWELQQRKAQTISDVLGEEGFANSLTPEDLEYLFSED